MKNIFSKISITILIFQLVHIFILLESLSKFVESIWDTIKNNKDLNLPS